MAFFYLLLSPTPGIPWFIPTWPNYTISNCIIVVLLLKMYCCGRWFEIITIFFFGVLGNNSRTNSCEVCTVPLSYIPFLFKNVSFYFIEAYSVFLFVLKILFSTFYFHFKLLNNIKFPYSLIVLLAISSTYSFYSHLFY